MTWIGKTLVIFNFLLALLWCGLTAATFAARANWQAETVRARAESAKAKEDADELRKAILQERSDNDGTRAQLAASFARESELVKQTGTLYTGSYELNVQRQVEDRKSDPAMQTALINTAKVQTDLDDKNAKLKELELSVDRYIKDTQSAIGRAGDAERLAAGSKVAQEKLQQEVRDANERFEAARNRQGDKAVPVPEGFRATVTGVDGEYAEINQGANSRLQAGSVLRITRAGKFVGYLRIEEIRQNTAVGVFSLPAGVKMQGANLPKANDEVTPRN